MTSIITTHECKGQPQIIPDNKVVEAFGFRKCPKLLEQVQSDDVMVRNVAIRSLQDEFLNPQFLTECIHLNIMNILIRLLSDENSTSQQLIVASLPVALKSGIALDSLLNEPCIPLFLHLLNSSEQKIRSYIFETLYQISASQRGVDNLVNHKDIMTILAKSTDENSSNKLIIIQTIYNLVSGSQQGLIQAMDNNIISKFIDIFQDHHTHLDYRIIAIKTIGFMCFYNEARAVTLQLNTIKICLEIILKVDDIIFISSILIALSSLTIDDSGKLQVYNCLDNGQAVKSVISYINHTHKGIQLNTMKVISNIAVYPKTRQIILQDSKVMDTLKVYSTHTDNMIQKHAKIALDVINWKP